LITASNFLDVREDCLLPRSGVASIESRPVAIRNGLKVSWESTSRGHKEEAFKSLMKAVPRLRIEKVAAEINKSARTGDM
jgi:hypothetical protein